MSDRCHQEKRRAGFDGTGVREGKIHGRFMGYDICRYVYMYISGILHYIIFFYISLYIHNCLTGGLSSKEEDIIEETAQCLQ